MTNRQLLAHQHEMETHRLGVARADWRTATTSEQQEDARRRMTACEHQLAEIARARAQMSRGTP